MSSTFARMDTSPAEIGVQDLPTEVPVDRAETAAESCGPGSERRSSPRRPLRLQTRLIPLGGLDAIECTSDDIAEQGVHVTVPIGYGLAVGQRHELILATPETSSNPERRLNGEGHYATVVRTRVLLSQGGDRVGVGLRFDQPLVM